MGKTPWKPHDSDSVWSKHFTDGEPNVAHCFLELKLIHEKKVSWIRRQIIKHPIPPKKNGKYVAEEINGKSHQKH